jgi:hypothetical protein
MSVTYRLGLLALPLALVLAVGCGSKAPPPTAGPMIDSSDEAEVQANLAALSADDRQLAEQQKFCAVESENRLGAMGTPFKVMIQGQPVFLCCKGCQKSATADPEKTLAAVQALKGKAAP